MKGNNGHALKTAPGRVLITFPWRLRCASSILCETLIDESRAERVIWVTNEGTTIPPGWGRTPPRHRMPVDFCFDPIRGPRLINSLLFRLSAYHTVQNFTIGRRIEACADQLEAIVRQVQPAGLWGLADQLNLPILDALSRRVDLPIHLSVHDEPESRLQDASHWPNTTVRRIRSSWQRLVERASSLDVVSEGMAEHIRQHWRREAVVVPPVPRLPLVDQPPPARARVLRIGMSGCWSGVDDAIACMVAGLEAAHQEGLFDSVDWVWADGENAMHNARLRALFAATPRIQLRLLPRLAEPDAVEAFAGCHLLYLPFWNQSQLFDATSNPSKLTTYLPAVRPILIHGSENSVPVRFGRKCEIGVLWTNLAPHEFPALLRQALGQLDDWSRLQTQYRKLIAEHLSLDRNRERFWQVLDATLSGQRQL